ncbi:MAG: hypothetical protein AAGI53_13650 [Planctomycetota bacterium]
MVYLPLASSGKACDNPFGFPAWRERWEPNPKDVAQRPDALTGIFRRVDRLWERGYRRFMFHRFGGDQAGGSYSAAQWWTFGEEQRFWFMSDDFDPKHEVPMGLKAYIEQKKAEDPSAEFTIYLGPILYQVDSLIQEEPPYAHTEAAYRECDPLGADPQNLIPDEPTEARMRSMCLGFEDDVGRTNQLWLTLGAFVEMGFDGAYFDALGGNDGGEGASCAGLLAMLEQYAEPGFRMGIEPVSNTKTSDHHAPVSDALVRAPSVSKYRYLDGRIRPRHDGIHPDWDIRGTGGEASIVIKDVDWSSDPSVGAEPDDNSLTIERLYQLLRHGYTPMVYANNDTLSEEGIAMLTDIGPVTCPADLSFDGNVNTDDILLFIERFVNVPEPINGRLGIYHTDYFDDDMLDLSDVNAFIHAYLAGCG